MPRLVTYNVHRCLGVDGRLSPERIADVIAACAPDVVALQELDVRRARSGHVDQAVLIAERLAMQLHFHPALRLQEEAYGDAILSLHPMRLVRADVLPGLASRPRLEPRGALWVEVMLDGRPLQVINTHLGLLARERDAQIEALTGPGWLGHPDCREPLILTGDFNAPWQTRAYATLARRLLDAQHGHTKRPLRTFPSRFPLMALDHVFTRGRIDIRRVAALATPVARVASDHLPLVVEFELPPAATPESAGATAALSG